MASSAILAARVYSPASISSRMACRCSSSDSPSHCSSCANFFLMSSSVKPQRWDGSPDVLFRLSLQFFRGVREKTKEDRAANCHNEETHLASWFDVGMESGGSHIAWRSATNARSAD